MNYIAQIKGFWMLHEKHAFSATDISLYFYLLEVCNSANWVNPFKRNTSKIITDLKISRSSLERSRKRLSKCGIIYFKSIKGTANITYQLADLEALFRNRNKPADATCNASPDAGSDATCDASADQLNKNSKPKPKQIVVVTNAEAFQFFADTSNCRLLKEKFGFDDAAIEDFFKIFYDSKIDLGDLNNKTLAETARNFYYWLPKYLAAEQREKEKSCAKKESFHHAAKEQPVRGVAAAMKFAGVKMRGEL
jgi:predicted transcriptional regulator